jgi:hypothetical protein
MTETSASSGLSFAIVAAQITQCPPCGQLGLLCDVEDDAVVDHVWIFERETGTVALRFDQVLRVTRINPAGSWWVKRCRKTYLLSRFE